MTRLGKASALIAVFAGGYAILMLSNGQLTDFDVSAGICAAALLGATLTEYVVRLSRKTLADGRAAVWERRDREASTMRPLPAPHFRRPKSEPVGQQRHRFPALTLSPAGWRTGIARLAPGPTPTSGCRRKPPLRFRSSAAASCGCTRTTNAAPVKALTKPKKY
jgi:hypothetical protein